MTDPISWEAARCLQRGWVPVPVELHGKSPALGAAWENVRPTIDSIPQLFFNRSIGVLLGAPSGHLVDVDLDCEEAVRLSYLLPPTACRFGRAGRETHFLYQCPIEKTTRYQTKESGTVIEIRSNGGQTVIPPSYWQDDATGALAPRLWTCDGPPGHVDPKFLLRAVEVIAGMSLLAQALKAEGIRHDAAMALAGGLARSGWSDEAVRGFTMKICEVADHQNMSDRLHGINTTLEAIKNKQAATGWPKLIDLIGKNVVTRASKWLKLDGDVGTGTGLGDVSTWKLTQEGTDPPMWRVEVGANRTVRVSSDTLASPDKMKLAIANQLGEFPQMPKKKLYDQFLSDASKLKEFEERSEDAEYTSAVIELVERWLATRPHSTEWQQLDEDQNIFVENEGKKYEATRIDLVEHMLRDKGVKIDLHDLPDLMRKMGFDNRRAPMGRRARCWVRVVS